MGRYLDLVRDLATDVPAIDSGVRTDQTKSPREVSSLLSLLSHSDPSTKQEPETEEVEIFASDRAPPSSRKNATAPPLLIRDSASTPATKATKATKSRLPSLLSRSENADGGPDFWHGLYEERTAIRQYDGSYRSDEAERLAWGELQNRWHMAGDERVSRQLCAGCRRPFGSSEALDMIDGNRIHITDGYDCLIRHGERWRRAATAGLRALVLDPPPDPRRGPRG